MIVDAVKPFAGQGPDAEFAAFVEQGEFKLQQCQDCQSHVFYPRLLCTHCGSQALQWKMASGKGVVYSTSVPRGGKDGDYNIALIDLQEGPRMMSRVVDISPDNVSIGMAVTAFIGDIDGASVVLFRPEAG